MATTATPPATLRFLGGVGTVTGSKFLVRAGGSQVLVDCGLFQGLRELRERNWDDPGIDPAALDAVVLTHAHLDHCGHLPRLVAQGFRGRVIATPNTRALAGIVLPDSGHLNEEEALYANRKGFSRHDPALPLYTEQDAWDAVEMIEEVPFEADCEVSPGMVVRFTRAGHILGAATVTLHVDEGNGASFAFSGDLGRPNHPLLVAPDPAPACRVLLVESTYGNRRHEEESAIARLADTIRRTVERGGSVLIPAFAVDRTEVLLVHLAQMARDGRLPRGVPVFVDSPMALSALRVYRDAIARGDPEVRRDVTDEDPFAVPGLVEVQDVERSKELNRPREPSIVISASGMASGGRVVHHLAHFLPDARNSIVLVGFQAEGTRGRQLAEGAQVLKMLGRYVPVRAEVANLRSFSVHADSAELLDWVRSASSPPHTVFAVHGEPAASAGLAVAIREAADIAAVVPRLGERVSLRA